MPSGPIWPINPRHTELYPVALLRLGRRPAGSADMVVFGIKGSAAVDELEALGALGARAAVIYDNGFAEAGEAGAALQARLVATCRRYARCAANCMGTIGAHDGFSSYRLVITEPEQFRGGVGLVSHSGSITIGLLADVRRCGFSKVVSAGNEAVADAADYIGTSSTIRTPASSPVSWRRCAGRPRSGPALARAARPKSLWSSPRSGAARAPGTSPTRAALPARRRYSPTCCAASTPSRSPTSSRCRKFSPRSTGRGGLRPAYRSRHRLGRTSRAAARCRRCCPATFRRSIVRRSPKPSRVVGPITGDGNPLDCWGNGDVRTNLAARSICSGGIPAMMRSRCATSSRTVRRSASPTRRSGAGRGVRVRSDKPFYASTCAPA